MNKPKVRFSDQLVRFRRESRFANGREVREVRGEILRKLLSRPGIHRGGAGRKKC